MADVYSDDDDCATDFFAATRSQNNPIKARKEKKYHIMIAL